MMLGIGLTATLAASVAAYFVKTDQSGIDLEHVAARLDRVEALLLNLKAQAARIDGRERFPQED